MTKPIQVKPPSTNLLKEHGVSGYASDQQKKAVKAIDQVTEIIVEEGEWVTYDDFVSLLHQAKRRQARG